MVISPCLDQTILLYLKEQLAVYEEGGVQFGTDSFQGKTAVCAVW